MLKRKHTGLSLVEINIALLLVSVMLLALYAAVVSSIHLSQKDALYTEATQLCQRRLEDVLLTARNRDQFALMTDAPPAYVGDYNGDDKHFVCLETVQNVILDPADFGFDRLKRITVQVFLARPGASQPTPLGTPLVQLSTVATAL